LDHHHVVVVVVAGDSYIEFPISIDLNDMGCNIRGIGWYKCNLLDCWRVVVFVILDCFVLADNNYNGGLFLRSVVWVRLKCLWWIGDIEKVWEEEDKKKERGRKLKVDFGPLWSALGINNGYKKVFMNLSAIAHFKSVESTLKPKFDFWKSTFCGIVDQIWFVRTMVWDNDKKRMMVW